MSHKYLGAEFDIHGGGYDLKFPHHENEIAQNIGSCNHAGAKYWLHANMLLLKSRKMSKSDGNTISPMQLFSGESEHISKAYTPMAIRFFMLQAHYRSTLDITDDGLQAAEKGYKRLMETRKILQSLVGKSLVITDLDKEITDLMTAAYDDMSDDFNAPRALGRLFELLSKINALKGGQLDLSQITEGSLSELKTMFNDFIFHIFGLLDESATGSNGASALEGVMNLVIDLRSQARTNKDWGTSDKIRDGLKAAGIQVKDAKEGTTWTKD